MTDLDKFVEVYRGHDPVAAQMLEDVLRKEGFEPRLVGTRNAALMGVGQNIVSMRIEVPASMSGEARALVESVLNDTVDVPWGEDDYPGDQEDDIEAAGQGRAAVDRPPEASSDAYRPPRRLEADGNEKDKDRSPSKEKNRILALGVVAVMPGLSQIYGGRPLSGLFLMLGLGMTLVLSLYRLETFVLGMAYVASFFIDVVAGQKAVSAYNRGVKTSRSIQILYGIAQVGLVQVLAYATTFLPQPPNS